MWYVYGMATSYSLDLRQRVWNAWQKGEGSQRELARRFAVSLSFVRDLSRRFRASGSIAAKPRGGGRPPLAGTAALARVQALVAARNDATNDEYHQGLLAEGYSWSRATVGRVLLRLRLTSKKKTLGDDERGSERVQALRAAFPGKLAGVAARDLVFVDESGVNVAMTRLYARSPRGTRAYGTAPRNWGENVSILSALSLEGPLATMYLRGATDGAVFLTYLKEVLVPKLWQGAVVIMDNLRAHKVKGVEELIQAAGARVVYLPPYSPDFNPIELAWSQLKNHLRKVAARTTEALGQAIGEGLARISPSNARGYFTHRGYCG